MTTPFLIANTRVGLERDIEPWLLPNDAYPEIEDAYLWRGRIIKKQGYQLLGRLSRVIGTTDGAGNATITIFGIDATFTMPIGDASFVVGSTTYTDTGDIVNVPPHLTTNSGGTGTATFDRAVNVNQLVIAGGPPSTDIIFYPGLPVMGLPTLESTIFNQGILMGFDTKYSYQFNNTTGLWNDASFHNNTANPVAWTGSDSQLFWSTNYAAAMWSTNNNPGFQNLPTTTVLANGDGIRWFDQAGGGWVNFLPPVDGTNSLMGALCIVPYKGRLITFSTWEGTAIGAKTQFAQRARWSQNGTPFYSAVAGAVPTNYSGGFNADAWRSDIAGRGGYIDAPTLEKIASVQFVKDTLIVYFESSTWQLVYTGFEQLPFTWVKINTELGATSTFSEVPFDKIVLGIGDTGIHACDSVNVERVDQKIPDEVFAIQNENNGRFRVFGIRDYFNQLVYWSMPYVGPDVQNAIDDENSNLPPPGVSITFPNKILVYNYIDQSYSFFNDSFTCFGYFQRISDVRWQDMTKEWQETFFPWAAQENIFQFPYIVAGNQQGFVEIIDPNVIPNGDSLHITNWDTATQIITIVNHNLNVGNFIKISSAGGITFPTVNVFKIAKVNDANNVVIAITPQSAPTGTFTGPGFLSVLPNFNVITKRFNPFIDEATQVRLSYMDVYCQSTEHGALTVNLYINEDGSLPINRNDYNTINTFPETTYQTSPDVTPFINSKIWKRINFTDVSQLFQFQFTLSDAQMLDDNIVNSPIEIHGLMLYFSKGGRLINV